MPDAASLTVTVFLAALVGSLHCLGMCGGFAGALAFTRGERLTATRLSLRHGLYHLGKTTSYVFLGALAATAGTAIQQGGGLRSAQILLSALAGAVMIGLGLQLLGWWPGRRGPGAFAAWLAPVFAPLLRPKGAGGPLALGVFNGFLPCPLVYAFVAQAAATGNVFHGMAIMVGLGLGTVPMLSLVGTASRWMTQARRARMVRVAGALLILYGAVTIVRGTPAHRHEHAAPAGTAVDHAHHGHQM